MENKTTRLTEDFEKQQLREGQHSTEFSRFAIESSNQSELKQYLKFLCLRLHKKVNTLIQEAGNKSEFMYSFSIIVQLLTL